MRRDGITGLVCLTASLALLALTYGLPGPSLLVPVGPGFYPRIVLGICAGFSLLLLIQALSAPRDARKQLRKESRPNYGLVFLTFAVFGVYVGVLPYIGYRLSTFAFVLSLHTLIEMPKTRRAWIVSFAFALITTVTTFYLFQDYLQVLLPRGRWTAF